LNSTDITLTNTYTCTSAGGTTLIKTNTQGSNCDLKGLNAGTGITITSGTNDNTIKTNFANGTGISITGTTTQTIKNTGVTSLTCTTTEFSCSGSTGDITLTGNWIKVCQSTLGSSGTSHSCGAFTAYKHLIVQIQYRITTSSYSAGLRFNSDSGNNYAHRVSANGGADTTSTARNDCLITSTLNNNDSAQTTLWIDNNQSGDRKSAYWLTQKGMDSSSATAPDRTEGVCKWDNTSAQITTINIIRDSLTGSLNTGTDITVWGYD